MTWSALKIVLLGVQPVKKDRGEAYFLRKNLMYI